MSRQAQRRSKVSPGAQGRNVRLPFTDRHLQVAAGGAALLALSLCLLLEPDPRGLGTHRHLGLPSCGFLEQTGTPCPTCGVTTSLCWFVRGQWERSLLLHHAGFAAGIVLVLAVPFSLLSALVGWQWTPYLRRVPVYGWTALVCVVLAALLVGWPHRIKRHLSVRADLVADGRASAVQTCHGLGPAERAHVPR